MRHDSDLSASYRRNTCDLGGDFPDIPADAWPSGICTDLGNVSQSIPAIHPYVGVDSYQFANHQPEFAGYCVGNTADLAIVRTATALAWTAIDAATDPELRSRLISS